MSEQLIETRHELRLPGLGPDDGLAHPANDDPERTAERRRERIQPQRLLHVLERHLVLLQDVEGDAQPPADETRLDACTLALRLGGEQHGASLRMLIPLRQLIGVLDLLDDCFQFLLLHHDANASIVAMPGSIRNGSDIAMQGPVTRDNLCEGHSPAELQEASSSTRRKSGPILRTIASCESCALGPTPSRPDLARRCGKG